MKVNILFSFKNGPSGGGNHFLSLLHSEYLKMGIYENDPIKSDIVIVNSYHNLIKAAKLKNHYPNIKLVFRLGPIFYYHRGNIWKLMDKFIIALANKIADGIIFQSHWSLAEANKLGFNAQKNWRIVYNTAGQTFYRDDNFIKNHSKIKILVASWSSNKNKGSGYYEYLDKHLDFSKYQMSFIGNSPVKFKNIAILSPLDGKSLAQELKAAEMFIFAAKDDACSNMLIEAMAAGLAVVALNSGGSSELAQFGNCKLFSNEKELLDAIAGLVVSVDHRSGLGTAVTLPTPETVAREYLSVIDQDKKATECSFWLVLKVRFYISLFVLIGKLKFIYG